MDNTFPQESERVSMNHFGPSASNNKPGSLSPGGRRSSTTAFESSSQSFSRDLSSQPNRRFSNPTSQPSASYASKSASCSRSRSPSDSQCIVGGGGGGGVGVGGVGVGRRFSQPLSSYSALAYGGGREGEEDEGEGEGRSLASKEKESYSSLTYLPEVRAYLRFMEDDIPLPHRSKSFNGRNSSRRSSYNRRKRSKSRTRTPTPTPMEFEDDDCFQKQFLFEQSEAKVYGRFLTPQRSLEPNCSSSSRSQSIDFTDMSQMSLAARCMKHEEPAAKEALPRRRSGSIIRTSFI